MSSHITILESAISDVGCWRWWSGDKLPESFQLEFGGVQMWSSTACGMLALRLMRPKRITLWTRADVDADWFEAIHGDELGPFNIQYDRFTLSSHEDAATWAGDAATKHDYFVANGEASSVIAFWAGPVGLHALCERIDVVNMDGPLAPEAIEDANQKWWAYWREYWSRKHGTDPMPYDGTCEVCIPLGK